MFDALKRWRQRRVLERDRAARARSGSEAVASLPFVVALTPTPTRAQLRDLVVLFLDRKSIVGAGGHDVTPLQRVVIAIQACVLVLELALDWYDDFENVVVYPGRVRARAGPGRTRRASCTRTTAPLAGEAMPGGPVVLSWPDVEASADFEAAGMNLVIHEFAHKLDMRDGDANGCPPLAPPLDARPGRRRSTAAYDDFAARVDRDEDDGDRSLRGRQPGRILRGALRGVLRVARRRCSARLPGRLPPVRGVLPPGSGGRAAAAPAS